MPFIRVARAKSAFHRSTGRNMQRDLDRLVAQTDRLVEEQQTLSLEVDQLRSDTKDLGERLNLLESTMSELRLQVAALETSTRKLALTAEPGAG